MKICRTAVMLISCWPRKAKTGAFALSWPAQISQTVESTGQLRKMDCKYVKIPRYILKRQMKCHIQLLCARFKMQFSATFFIPKNFSVFLFVATPIFILQAYAKIIFNMRMLDAKQGQNGCSCSSSFNSR